jgi:adenosylmethionine-8-amino-7-oxononanoate aminotransferase
VRVLGAIGVVELDRPVDVAKTVPRFVERGVWLRPFGNVIYTIPPYVISEGDLEQVTDAIHDIVQGGGI